MSGPKLISTLGLHLSKENYLTNALVGAVSALLEPDFPEQDRGVALAILDLIATTESDPDFTNDSHIKVESQKTTDEGTPDIKVSSKRRDGSIRKVFIEVKDCAAVEPGQLVRYKRSLKKEPAEIKCLTLLSRPLVKIRREDEEAINSHIYWHQVVEVVRKSARTESEVAQYILESLLQFLEEEKKMALAKVKGHYAKQGSLEDLARLAELLKLSLKDAGLKPKRSEPTLEPGEETWFGFYAKYEEREFSAGVFADRPGKVVLRLEEGPSYSEKVLDLGGKAFFAMTVTEQMGVLKSFLRRSASKLLKENPKRRQKK